MARRTDVIRLSSKGQIVIPADLRRRMGWKTGQPLVVRAGDRGEIILRLVDQDDRSFDEMLRRFRDAAREIGRDRVAELHARRRREREREARKYGPRSH